MRSRWRTWSTLDHAAAALHCSIDALRALRATEDGGRAFRNGRVYERDLQEHLEKLRDEKLDLGTKQGVQIAKLKEEHRRLKLANDTKEGKLILRSAVADEFARVFGPVMAQVEQKLVNEYPGAVAGLEPEAARVYGKRVYDAILEAHRQAAEKWSA